MVYGVWSRFLAPLKGLGVESLGGPILGSLDETSYEFRSTSGDCGGVSFGSFFSSRGPYIDPKQCVSYCRDTRPGHPIYRNSHLGSRSSLVLALWGVL